MSKERMTEKRDPLAEPGCDAPDSLDPVVPAPCTAVPNAFSTDSLGPVAAAKEKVPGCTRTLRILQILLEHTDAHHRLSSSDIQELLANPPDPALPSLKAGRSAIRTSMDSLRAAGINVVSASRRGYALIGHPLPNRDAELIVRAISSSRLLSGVQKERLTESILRFASPTQRAALMPRRMVNNDLRVPSAQQRSQTTQSFYIEQPEMLVRLAIASNASFTFEFVQQPAKDVQEQQLTGHGRPRRLRPRSLFEARGAAFVQGISLDTDTDDIPIDRVIQLDRMANLVLVDDDGILHLSFGAASLTLRDAPRAEGSAQTPPV